MRSIGFCLFFLLLLVSTIGFAQNTSWTGSVSTSWTNAGNWTNGVPTATSDVNIGNGSFTGSFQPIISSNVTIGSLTLGLGFKASTLTVTRNLTVNGDISIWFSGTLIHQSNRTISLTGNWLSIFGTYTPQSVGNQHSEVIFSGASQSLTSLNATTFAKLTINATSTTTSASDITVTQNFVVNGIFDPGTTTVTLSGASFVVASNATIRVNTPTFVENYTLNPTLDSRSIVEYNSTSAAQTIAVLGYGNLIFNGASVKSLSGNITAASSPPTNGNVTVNAGTLNLGTYSLNRGSTGGGTFTLANNATLRIGGTGTFPSNFSTNTIANTSLVEYYGTNQSVALQNYGNLTLNGTGTKTFAAGITSMNTFTNASTATIPNGSSVQLQGNWVNNGTITPTTYTTIFAGTTTQSISGTSITSFNNITVTNTSNPGVNVQSNQNLRGRLLLNANVIFDADGTGNTSVFTLLSSADSPTNDASIGILPTGAQVRGNVTVQRFMSLEGPSNNRIYRYISSPIQVARVSDIQNEIPITGAFTGSSSCTGCSKTASMYYYSEAITTDTNGSGVADLNDGYIAFPTTANTESLAIGRGYAMFVRGNVIGSSQWDVRGVINAGNSSVITFPVTYTNSGSSANDGWNLIGNPFPSTIDWNAASGWTKTNMTASIYTRDNGSATGQFAVWNGSVGVNGGSRYVAMGQGFWVKGTGTGTPVLRANENVKASGTQTTFFRESEPSDVLRITLASANVQDETVIHFREDATNSLDELDAIKWPGSAVNLSSMIDGDQKLAINSLAREGCSQTVPLVIDQVTPGNYMLSFSDFESFSTLDSIVLTDHFTGDHIQVSENAYSFIVTSHPSSFGDKRFVLSFHRTLHDDKLAVSTTPLCEGTEGSIQIDGSRIGVSYSLWMNGNQLSEPVNGTDGAITIGINAVGYTPGQHIVSLRSSLDQCGISTSRDIQIEVMQKPEPLAMTNGQSCGEGSITLTAGNSGEQITWYDGNKVMVGNGNTFVTPQLTRSTEYFASRRNQYGCESELTNVEAAVIYLDEVVIEEQNGVLHSSAQEGNQWYYNGDLLVGETNSFLEPNRSGMYSVVISQNGCKTDDKLQFNAFKNDEVAIYPNPTSGFVTIETGELFPNAHSVIIVDLLGHEVGRVQLRKELGTPSGNFDLSSLPAGTYIFSVLGMDKKVQVKVIRQ